MVHISQQMQQSALMALYLVVPNDTTEIPVTRALYVGVGGDIHVVMADGQTATFVSVPTGIILPIQVSKVLVATVATDILALY